MTQAPERRLGRSWNVSFAFVAVLTVVTVVFGVAARSGSLNSDYWLLVWLAIVLGWMIALLALGALLLARGAGRLARRSSRTRNS